MHKHAVSGALRRMRIPAVIPVRRRRSSLGYAVGPMARPVQAAGLVAGMLTENTSHMLVQTNFNAACPYPAAQRRIEMFHDRMRAEGLVPKTHPQSAEDRWRRAKRAGSG